MISKMAKGAASIQGSATSSQACHPTSNVERRQNNNQGLGPTTRSMHAAAAVQSAGMQNFGRVDHYFLSGTRNGEPQQNTMGSEFLKQLFQYQLPSCIAVQGGGTEGYVVNKAYIMEEQLKQEKLLQLVENLKRENEKLKNHTA
ncbi:hypothetical protein HOP50_02g17400 [Chloropicon primus]|uniref:Uncharacterized protein n=2 Tax=Chloropicon primus TaxID=1764295 RepID=A0A5B8MHU5_9CHLO|nr:hypothetical protein A3770_02p17430 [Chloropicon primus]UPQ98434.1 hypothetical protein HOP50_02g17400 [Chloropicon primus]|eukprot:QDZ19225.1 hypothetical protein A3770_02p17430 [Chloropicon primus]